MSRPCEAFSADPDAVYDREVVIDLDKLEPFIGPPLKDSFMKYYNMDS